MVAFPFGPETFWMCLLQTGVLTISCSQVVGANKFMEGIIWNLGHVMPTTSSHAEIEMVAKVGSGLDICH